MALAALLDFYGEQKGSAIMIGVIFLFLLSMNTAYAYLDPGTGSILLQALFAGIAGLCALLKIYWNKITEWFKSDKKERADETQQADD